jgi:tetratricopeptide (TPR) repeat protein
MKALHRCGRRIVLAVLFACGATAALAPAWGSSVQENVAQVLQWNRFANRLHAIHRTFLRRYEIRTEEEIGGYAGRPDFYREVSYFDDKTDRLLSRIRWEREHPDRIHVIELFFYDAQGRVTRDYSAAFLPDYRNAPHQTLINVYGYNGELHAFRQFDASGARLYEYCEGSWFDEPVAIALDEPLVATPDSLLNSEPYIACFGTMPTSPGGFLDQAAGGDDLPPDQQGGGDEDAAMRAAALSLQLRFSPESPALYMKRCRAYFVLLDFDKAIDDCSRAIELDAQLDEAYFWRGMARGRHGLIDQGIEDLGVFIARHPDSSLAYTKRGVRHIWNGDLEAAEKDLKRAVELDPNNAEAHDDLGVVLAQRQAYAEAMDHFRTTIRIEPKYQKAHHNLALVLHLLSREEEALDAIDDALRVGPDSRSSVLLKGNILEALGRSSEARALKEKAESMPEKNWSENLAIQ